MLKNRSLFKFSLRRKLLTSNEIVGTVIWLNEITPHPSFDWSFTNKLGCEKRIIDCKRNQYSRYIRQITSWGLFENLFSEIISFPDEVPSEVLWPSTAHYYLTMLGLRKHLYPLLGSFLSVPFYRPSYSWLVLGVHVYKYKFVPLVLWINYNFTSSITNTKKSTCEAFCQQRPQRTKHKTTTTKSLGSVT